MLKIFKKQIKEYKKLNTKQKNNIHLKIVCLVVSIILCFVNLWCLLIVLFLIYFDWIKPVMDYNKQQKLFGKVK